MDPVENMRATAHELVLVARHRGLDLKPLLQLDYVLQDDRRWIFVWRKDELPYSGRAGEEIGTLHYNMQGTISVLPSDLKGSESAFRGMWSEAGTCESMEQMFELMKAWLVDRREIDDLPVRFVRRGGI